MLVLAADPWDRVIPETRWTVWAKPYWATPNWTYLPYLECVRFKHAAPPDEGTAEFLLRYGDMAYYESLGHELYTPADLNNYYIAVFGHRPDFTWPDWIGVVKTLGFDLHAVRDGVPFAGDEHFHAYSLESLLKRRKIWGSVTTVGGIGRTLAFNRRYGHGQSPAGNRSSSGDPATGSYVFGGTEDWSALQILQYLLTYFWTANMPINLTGQLSPLQQMKPTLDVEGKSLWDVFNTLIDFQRGLGWHFVITPFGVDMVVFSTVSTPVTFGETTIPAHNWQTIVDFADYPEVNPRILASNVAQYDTVAVASEEPVKVCFTATFANGLLEKGWSDTEEAAYLAATDEERATDKFSRVFTTFRVPAAASWAGIVPSVNNSGGVSTSTPSAVYRTGKAFERTLPFVEATDATGAELQYRDLFALIHTGTAYAYVDRLTELGVDGARDCSVQPLDRELGIEIKANPNHLLALNHWTDAEETEVEPLFDYTTLVVTVFMETDARLQVVAPLWGAAAGETGETLFVPAPGIEYWLAAPNTVTDVTEGALTYYGGTVVRDDGAKLRALAASVLAYYGAPSCPLEYELVGPLPIHPVGSFIAGAVSGWHAQIVGAPVTERSVDCRSGRMTVRTGQRNLDYKGAVS